MIRPKHLTLRRFEIRLRITPGHTTKSTGIVNFISKVSPLLNLSLIETKVSTNRRGSHQTETQTVRAIFFHEVNRIRRIAERFTHLPTLDIADDRGEEDVLKRQLLPFKAVARHHHARDPKEDNVRTRSRDQPSGKTFSPS